MFEFDNIDPISTLNWSRLYPLVVTWGVSCQFHSVVVLALKYKKIDIKIGEKNDLMADKLKPGTKTKNQNIVCWCNGKFDNFVVHFE